MFCANCGNKALEEDEFCTECGVTLEIDLNKTEKNKILYYYTEKGEQFGPFNRNQLLSKIDRNSLVWREGIDWTNASEIKEFKEYFLKITKADAKPLKRELKWKLNRNII